MTSLWEVDLWLTLLRQLKINRNQLDTFSDSNHFSFKRGKTLRKKNQSSNRWKYQKMRNAWLWREVSYCLAEICLAWLWLWLIFRFHIKCCCECEYLWNISLGVQMCWRMCECACRVIFFNCLSACLNSTRLRDDHRGRGTTPSL